MRDEEKQKLIAKRVDVQQKENIAEIAEKLEVQEYKFNSFLQIFDKYVDKLIEIDKNVKEVKEACLKIANLLKK